MLVAVQMDENPVAGADEDVGHRARHGHWAHGAHGHARGNGWKSSAGRVKELVC